MAAVDYFLKIDGIDGESKDKEFKNHIQIDSWSWSSQQGGTMSAGGGGGAGKVQMQDFHFTMQMCKATPKLFLHCCNGKHVPKAELNARKAGGDQQKYLKVTFSDLLVSSYNVSGSGEGAPIPVDQISLNYSKIEYEYKEQQKDGTLGGPIKFGYDLKEMKQV